MPNPRLLSLVEEKQIIQLIGEVDNVEKRTDNQAICLNNLKLINSDKEKQCIPLKESKVLVYVEKEVQVSFGSTLRVKGAMFFYDRPRNPGNFNQKFYYFKDGIHGYVLPDTVEVLEYKEHGLRQWFFNLKEKWKKMLVDNLGEETGGICSTILLGEKAAMNAGKKELYQRNGIGHILAISGLHITIVGISIYQMQRKMGIPIWLSACIGGIFLLFYMLLTGFSVSSTRAFVMYLIRMLAEMTGRIYDMPTSLSIAAVITISIQPLIILDASFLLSFLAILGIIVWRPILGDFFPISNKYFAGIHISIAVNLMLFPVMLYFFFEFPLYSILTNLLVVPSFALVLGIGFIGSGIFTFFPIIGKLLLQSIGLIFIYYEKICHLMMKLPFARIVTGQPKTWQIALYYILLYILYRVVHSRINKDKAYKRKLVQHVSKRTQSANFFLKIKRGGAFIIAVCLISTLCHLPTNKRDMVSITMLDVGQGDCIFIRGPAGKSYLIDGGSVDVDHAGKYRIEPFLKSQGVGKLDYVFVSHGDEDHLNGIRELMQRKEVGIKIDSLVLPENSGMDEVLLDLRREALQIGIDVYSIKQFEIIKEEDLSLQCLSSSDEELDISKNDGSMVLILKFRKFSMLFTGDIEEKGEKMLLEDFEKTSINVLKIAHHGSNTSTSQAFLSKVNPSIALISAGKDNYFGHPHKEVLDRLNDAKTSFLNTGQQGAISLLTDGEEIKFVDWK